jgi:hypothetical protein
VATIGGGATTALVAVIAGGGDVRMSIECTWRVAAMQMMVASMWGSLAHAARVHGSASILRHS